MSRIEDFPQPLATYVDISREGNATFCYSKQCGSFSFIVDEATEKLRRALALRGRGKAAALREALEFLARQQAKHQLVQAQWQTHLDDAPHRIREAAALLRQPAPTGAASPQHEATP